MAFQENLSVDTTMPGYVIYRDVLPGQYDPSAAPVFFPPKDSDELFDALRIAFPGVKTHSERMRDAMIKFLVEERQAEMAQHIITPLTAESVATPPWQQTFPSMSSSGSSSTFSSPDTLNLATPTFGLSPQPQMPQLSRHFSTSTSATPGPAGAPTPAGIEGMTGVFSVSTTAQPKQRVRRKMTEAEKVEYRKRRIVKACDKCSKRKRKCNHNQPEIDTLATKQKITKSKGAHTNMKPSSAQPPLLSQEILPSAYDFGLADDFAGDMLLFDDYTNIFEEAPYTFGLEQPKPCVPHLHGDYKSDRFATGRAQPCLIGDTDWRYDHSQQWNLQDPSLPQATGPGMQNTTGGRTLQTSTSANNTNLSEAMHLGQMAMAPNRSLPDPGTSASAAGSGNGMLWEHLRTGQKQPTHTRHAHEALGEAAFAFDDEAKNANASRGRPPLSSILPDAVLQVIATTKALRKLSRGLRSNGPKQLSIQLTTMSDIAAAIGSPRSSNGSNGRHLTAKGTKFVLHPRSALGRKQAQIDMFAPLDRAAPISGSLPGAITPASTSTLGGSQGLPATGPDRTGLERHAETSSSARPYPGADGRLSTMRGMSREATLKGEESTSTSVSSPRGTRTATHQGRPLFAHGTGEGLTDKPWAELNMLKRRIPKSLHSVTDRNNSPAIDQQQAVSRPDPGMQLPGKRNEPVHSRPHSATLIGESLGLQPLLPRANPSRAITDLREDRSGDLVWTHRNQDTFRCRDHFGRTTLVSPAGVAFSSGDGDSSASPARNWHTAGFSAAESILFALGMLLLLTSGVLGSAKLSASAFAVVLIYPVSDGPRGLFWTSGNSLWVHFVKGSLRSSLGRMSPMNQDDQKKFVGKRKMGSKTVDLGSGRPLAFGLAY